MESTTPKMDNRSDKSQTFSSSDAEKQGSPPEEAQLQRKLSSRHLQFVAIGMLPTPLTSSQTANSS
jgi:amino acid transporter